MEFADIMYGLVGFMVMFFAFCFLRMCYHGCLWLLRYWKQKQRKGAFEKKKAPMPYGETLREDTGNDEIL